MGCAYLHICILIIYRALKIQSRLYCTVAAYNTGARQCGSRFLVAMPMLKTSEQINKMQPSEVYRHLQARLPYQETRDYVERVSRRYQSYLA